MIRINAHQLVQFVWGDDQDSDLLVFMDESSGEEVTISRPHWPAMVAAVDYFVKTVQPVADGDYFVKTVQPVAPVPSVASPIPSRRPSADPFADGF